jgi:hypothetical protein
MARKESNIAPDETLAEAAAQLLPKSRLVSRLEGQGLDATGKQDELAQRVAHSFKSEDVLDMLDEKQLARIGKDFEVPAPPGKGLFETEKGRWIKHLAKFASKTRSMQGTNLAPSSRPIALEGTGVSAGPRPESSTSNVFSIEASQARPAVLPSLDSVLTFIKAYRFGYKWRSELEESYQAELLGALSTKFPDAVVRVEQAEGGGRRYDIVVGRVYIEVKLPKKPKDLQDMQGQVEKYRRAEKDLVAVIVEHHLTDRYGADIECQSLEAKGARVVRKQ